MNGYHPGLYLLAHLLKDASNLLDRILGREHHFKAVAVRFAGMYYTDPLTGELIMATQQFVVGETFHAPLSFFDAAGNAAPADFVPPALTPTASDPSVTVSMSADNKDVNVTMTTTLADPVTITVSDPTGTITATATVTDQVVTPPFVLASMTIGEFVPGAV